MLGATKLPPDPPTPSLIMARLPEEVDGYPEIALVVDDYSQVDMIPGYSMPRVDTKSTGATPDWVDREFTPSRRPNPVTVGVARSPRPTPWAEWPELSGGGPPHGDAGHDFR